LRDTWSFKYWGKLKSKKVDFFVFPFTSEFRAAPSLFFKPSADRCNEKNSQPPPGLFNYRGISCGTLVAPRLDYLFREYFPRLRNLIRQVHSFLKGRNVSLVVMDEDACDFNKILAKAAASQNIPSLVIQHGAPCLPYGFVPLSATHMAVWGELSHAKFSKWGTPASRMSITGVPKYDCLIEKDTLRNEATYRVLNFDPAKKTIMVCPGISAVNPFERYVENVSSFEENFGMIEESLSAVAALSNTQLIIKLHARDRDEVFIREHVDQRRLSNVRVLKVFDTIALLGITDLLIASYSSVVLEAMLLDIPIVTTNFSGLSDLMPYSEAGGALGVFQRDKLKAAIDSLLYDQAVQKTFKEGRDRFLAKFIYKTDGGSTKRVVELMDLLLAKADTRESEPPVKEVFTFPGKVL
jgi:glycosyltransferase involved in cell wall biosynthesis